jgi:hypothetical protein
MCSNPDETDGTVCDAMGISGTCETGVCIADCTPSPGMMVTLPTSEDPSGDPIPVYTDLASGFAIAAAGCSALNKCDVTFSFRGIGANAHGGLLAIDPGDSLLLEYFDANGNARTATDVQILLYAGGTEGVVEVAFDGGSAMSFSAVPGQAIDLTGFTAHAFEVTLTDSVPSARIFWQKLQYDHDCL